jgi:hypothetical protein
MKVRACVLARACVVMYYVRARMVLVRGERGFKDAYKISSARANAYSEYSVRCTDSARRKQNKRAHHVCRMDLRAQPALQGMRMALFRPVPHLPV